MKTEKKLHYEIVMVDDFSEVELATLFEYSRMHGIHEFTIEGLVFSVHMEENRDMMKDFAYIAAWLSRIGADGDIYCIRMVNTFYTGYVSPEVKYLMRT
jgi:hypothetical protein